VGGASAWPQCLPYQKQSVHATAVSYTGRNTFSPPPYLLCSASVTQSGWAAVLARKPACAAGRPSLRLVLSECQQRAGLFLLPLVLHTEAAVQLSSQHLSSRGRHRRPRQGPLCAVLGSSGRKGVWGQLLWPRLLWLRLLHQDFVGQLAISLEQLCTVCTLCLPGWRCAGVACSLQDR
jgi:hypothetical protein